MTGSLVSFGILGVISTVFAFVVNRRLFAGGRVGPPTALEGLYYVLGCVSLGLGWYFNVRYTHQYGHNATYVGYTKALFSNWAADSAAQDYIMVNLVLLPLWTIVEGRRRGLRAAWIFFVMSLFTSLAFSVAFYLAFVERQNRYNATATSDTDTDTDTDTGPEAAAPVVAAEQIAPTSTRGSTPIPAWEPELNA